VQGKERKKAAYGRKWKAFAAAAKGKRRDKAVRDHFGKALREGKIGKTPNAVEP